MNVVTNQGWQCPKCSRVWAPQVQACSPCNQMLDVVKPYGGSAPNATPPHYPKSWCSTGVLVTPVPAAVFEERFDRLNPDADRIDYVHQPDFQREFDRLADEGEAIARNNGELDVLSDWRGKEGINWNYTGEDASFQ